METYEARNGNIYEIETGPRGGKYYVDNYGTRKYVKSKNIRVREPVPIVSISIDDIIDMLRIVEEQAQILFVRKEKKETYTYKDLPKIKPKIDENTEFFGSDIFPMEGEPRGKFFFDMKDVTKDGTLIRAFAKSTVQQLKFNPVTRNPWTKKSLARFHLL